MVSKRTGSIKDKVVAADLQEERDKCNFNQKDLTIFLYDGKKSYERFLDWYKDMESDPILRNSHEFY